MPVTKSAQKEERVAARRQLVNKSVRSQCKTSVTKAEVLILSGELEAAQQAVATAIRSLDRAAEKGIIHPNNAARRKARLMKKLNGAMAAPAAAGAKPKPKPKPKAKAKAKTKTKTKTK